MKNTALVTGAEGFIGSHLARYLQAKGWNVVGTYLPDNHTSFPKLPRLDFVQCDLRNGQRITQLVNTYQPSHVFHLGAQSLPTVSWANPVATFESNIMGSLYLFEGVRRLKRAPVVVSACSSAEYGRVPASAIPVKEDRPLRPLHPYGISKVCLDLLAREYFLDYKIPAVNVRLFNTTGPGKTNDAPSDFVRQLVAIKKGLQRPVIEVGNLKPRRAFLDVNDTVRAFYLAAMKGKHGESYNVCATRTHKMSEILQRAIRLSGVKAEIRPVPRLMRPSDEKIIFGSTAKIRKDLGWKPLRTIDQTLQSMLDYWDHIL
ncbi:MAG TPA: GDP-mannose 4,6-dehydratase [Candidatus Dormibacteraeota bacterium]|jgi:GDP-4-dehydro-6-deoxy-D-mannose reductase|nr:GDP-mannose 4,6-dehydratase [Candidatus Dormibacteraeota bacterium]